MRLEPDPIIPHWSEDHLNSFVAERAWVAGLFEGEGCFTANRPSHGKDGHITLKATLEMTDEDIVRRFAEIVGMGRVRRRDFDNRKTMWVWSITSTRDFHRLLRMLSPWLGERRLARAKELVAKRDAYEDRRTYGRRLRLVNSDGTLVCRRRVA